jgi:Fe-S cluster assembly protein SufB
MSKYREDDLKIELETKEYEYGFYTELESDTFHWFKRDIVRAISLRKRRTRMDDQAYRAWEQMVEPEWANVNYAKPDFQAISYYSAPKLLILTRPDDVDPELLEMYKKLGISVDEQK